MFVPAAGIRAYATKNFAAAGTPLSHSYFTRDEKCGKKRGIRDTRGATIIKD